MERLLSTWYDLLLMKTSIFLVEKGAYVLKQPLSRLDLLNIINIFVLSKLSISVETTLRCRSSHKAQEQEKTGS